MQHGLSHESGGQSHSTAPEPPLEVCLALRVHRWGLGNPRQGGLMGERAPAQYEMKSALDHSPVGVGKAKKLKNMLLHRG